jgi:4-hydroxybenzoate polyprenyltransferase
MKVRRYPKWFMPVSSLGLGGACLAAFWLGGNRNQGLFSLALMGGLAAVFAFGGRSETIRGLRGDGRDEYWQGLDAGATLFAGLVLIVGAIAMCMWEWAHGRDGSPYVQLCALAGLAYMAALVALRLRR